MTKKEISLACAFFLIVTCVFFYKMVLKGFVPFPGDLLIAEYNPWKTYSYIGYAPGGYPDKAQYFDVLRQLYPWKTLVLQLLKKGIFPLWNPYNFSGSPLFANFQSAVLYPLNIVYLFLPQSMGWSLLVFLQPFLACWFTYLYARKMGIEKIGAFVSGLGYGFSTFLSVWLEYNTLGHVLLWLPLILLSVEYLIFKKTAWWLFVFIFSLVATSLAGHPQLFGYELFFIIIYILHQLIAEKKEGRIFSFIFFVAATIISLGISAIQYVPGIELIQNAARAAHPYDVVMKKILIQPSQLLMFFTPDFFGNPATRNYWPQDTYIGKMLSIGLIPFIFSLLTFTKLKSPIIRFFWGVTMVIILLVTPNPITQLIYHYNLPLISSSSPTLSVFLFCFAQSILAGFGITYFLADKFTLKKYLWWLGPITVFFVIILAILIAKPHIFLFENTIEKSVALKNFLYTCGLLAVTYLVVGFSLLKKNTKKYFLIILVVIMIIDSWRYFTRFNPFVPSSLIFPQAEIFQNLEKVSGIDRIWGMGSANIEANFATYYHLYSSDGYDPLYPRWYGEFIQSSKDGKIHNVFTDQTRSDAVIAPASKDDFAINIYRQKVLNLLGVKYILDRVENGATQATFPPANFSVVSKQNGWTILQNKNALPRAFLGSQVMMYTSPEDFGKKFFAPTFDPYKTILVQENLNNLDASATGKVVVSSYIPNNISLQTRTTGNMFLFLSDTFYPGWHAFVDNKEVPIYKADYAFRAINVPKGFHMIRFTFASSSFKIGSIVSLVSLIIAVVFILLVGKRRVYAKS